MGASGHPPTCQRWRPFQCVAAYPGNNNLFGSFARFGGRTHSPEAKSTQMKGGGLLHSSRRDFEDHRDMTAREGGERARE